MKRHALKDGVSTRTHHVAHTGCGIRVRASLRTPGPQNWYNPRGGRPVMVGNPLTCESCQDAVGQNPDAYSNIEAY